MQVRFCVSPKQGIDKMLWKRTKVLVHVSSNVQELPPHVVECLAELLKLCI